MRPGADGPPAGGAPLPLPGQEEALGLHSLHQPNTEASHSVIYIILYPLMFQVGFSFIVL